jgi:hypothetical protein
MTDPITQAQKYAAQTVQAYTNNKTVYLRQKANGIPARPAGPGFPAVEAVSAKDYLEALGADNVAELDRVYVAE